jgi:hypothetical protein
MLVMDELSNEVIVGLDWQRSTNLTITPGEECDLLNGQPVQRRVAAAQATGTSKEMGRPRSEGPIRLMAALVHAMTSSTPQTQTTCAGVVTRTENDRLKRVLSSHPSVFAEELPAKTVEQVERSLQFSIVLVGDMVRPVKQRERRMSPAEIAAASEWVKEEVAAGRMEPSSSEWAVKRA